MASAVPVIDIAPWRAGAAADKDAVARAFDAACTTIGFVVVSGHGVDPALIDRAFAVMTRFFDLPLEQKLTVRPVSPVYRGFMPIAKQGLAASLDNVTPPDLFERFSLGRVDVPDDPYHRSRKTTFFADNVWSPAVPEMAAVMSDYYRAMERLAGTLMRIFAAALGLDETFFDDKINRHITSLCINHYPAQETEPLPGQLRAGAHSDYGSLTILAPTDAPGGLQVLAKDGTWQDVAPVPGAFIVNLGDLMAQWTNDRWVSTMHRVVNPPRERAAESRRLSIVFFHQPNDDAVIECLPSCTGPGNPPKYAPVTSGAHLLTKVRKQMVKEQAA